VLIDTRRLPPGHPLRHRLLRTGPLVLPDPTPVVPQGHCYLTKGSVFLLLTDKICQKRDSAPVIRHFRLKRRIPINQQKIPFRLHYMTKYPIKDSERRA
jgi:hypothetical protein